MKKVGKCAANVLDEQEISNAHLSSVESMASVASVQTCVAGRSTGAIVASSSILSVGHSSLFRFNHLVAGAVPLSIWCVSSAVNKLNQRRLVQSSPLYPGGHPPPFASTTGLFFDGFRALCLLCDIVWCE
jgi:hypothetical protein